MPDLMAPPAAYRKPGTFTAQTARLAAQRSVASRAIASQRRKEQPKAEPLPKPAAVQAVDDYAQAVLERTRTQLDLVAQRITEELESDMPDTRRLRDLADAQHKLSEQERILAGRPLPGSKKPAPERATKPREAGAWLAVADPPAALAETPAPARPLGWEYDVPTATPAPGQVMPGPAPDPVPPAV